MVNQTVTKRIKHFQDFGNSLAHAKAYFRDDWKIIYFDLSGKMFGLLSPTASETSIITLKGDPESNVALREIYSDITAGYYANKKHWNTIKLSTSELSDQQIEKMITHSYKLVYENLPLYVRKAFAASD